jgi:hypothetical protein
VDRIFLKDVEAWTGADLEDFVAAKFPEGLRLEYKRELTLERKTQRAEAAKDVSGLANAQGGLLLYGIEEDDGEDPLPKAIVPITDEGLQTRLENVLDDALAPRASFQAATVPVGNGVVIVIRIEPQLGEPVMVQGYGEYRYYRRSGTRTIRMSASEVAEAHAKARGMEEELIKVLHSLPLRARITRPRSLDEAKLALHGQIKPEWTPLATVVVAALDCHRPLLTPDRISPDAFPEVWEGKRGENSSRAVRPPGRWILDGHGLHHEETYEEGVIAKRVAIYRPGVFEWARRYRGGEPELPGKTLADDVHDALLYAAGVFPDLGYFGRLATYVRIENAEQAIPQVPADWDLALRPAGVEWIGLRQDVAVDELQQDPTPTVRKAMDVLWQGFGVTRCPYFDQGGDWDYEQ